MTRFAGALSLLIAGGLAGCNWLDPYPTSVSDPYATNIRHDEASQPSGERVGVCYNTLATTLPQVREQAQKECPEGTTAEPLDTDWHLQTCPLLLPARASFVCLKK